MRASHQHQSLRVYPSAFLSEFAIALGSNSELQKSTFAEKIDRWAMFVGRPRYTFARTTDSFNNANILFDHTMLYWCAFTRKMFLDIQKTSIRTDHSISQLR